MIIGTGTNACYLEDIDRVDTWDGDKGDPKHVIINTEWGAFGDHGELQFVRTKWDEEVDRTSLNPGRQTFEKMISGMYMGELVRLVVLDIIQEGLIFQNQNTTKFRTSGSFPTKYLSEIEADPVGDYQPLVLPSQPLTRPRTVSSSKPSKPHTPGWFHSV